MCPFISGVGVIRAGGARAPGAPHVAGPAFYPRPFTPEFLLL